VRISAKPRLEIGIAELRRRHIHREADTGPGERIAAGAAEHPGTELVDQAALLGDGDEGRGRHRPEAGPGPAQERLDAHHPLRAGIEDRLISDVQAVAAESPAEILGDLQALLADRIDQGVIEEQAVRALLLGLVHGDVGATQQLLR